MTNNVIMIITASFCNVLAQVSLKKAAGFNLLEAGLGTATLLNLVKNAYLWAGIISYVISFGLTIKIYETSKLSFVTPLSIGIIFILTTVLSIVILKESFNIKQGFGILIIFIGVVFLSAAGQK